jgi:hypothetical protein
MKFDDFGRMKLWSALENCRNQLDRIHMSAWL